MQNKNKITEESPRETSKGSGETIKNLSPKKHTHLNCTRAPLTKVVSASVRAQRGKQQQQGKVQSLTEQAPIALRITTQVKENSQII